jgi:hypothetical protein
MTCRGREEIDVFGPGKESRISIIREHLERGHLVTSGYYATSVRGYHNHVILWKETKSKTILDNSLKT